MEILDADRLENARVTDARYHLARLVAQGFNAGAQVVWDEHEQWRHETLTPPQVLPRPTLEARALALFRRARTNAAATGAN